MPADTGGEGDRRKAALLEPAQHGRQRRQRLRRGQQAHEVSRLPFRRPLAHERRVCTRRVFRPQNGGIAERLGGIQKPVAVGAAGRQKQRRPRARQRFDQRPAQAELLLALFLGKGGHIPLEVAEIPHFVPAGGDLAQRARVPVRPAAADKEGRLGAVFVQDVQDGRDIFFPFIYAKQQRDLRAAAVPFREDAAGTARGGHADGIQADAGDGEYDRRQADVADDRKLSIALQYTPPHSKEFPSIYAQREKTMRGGKSRARRKVLSYI